LSPQRKSRIGLLVALSSPFVAMQFVDGWTVAGVAVASVVAVRVVMDVIWPDRKDES
jgi:hypothetical protein